MATPIWWSSCHTETVTCSTVHAHAVQSEHSCAIKQLQQTVSTLLVRCFFAEPKRNGLNTTTARPKLAKEMLPLRGFPVSSPSSGPRTTAVTSCIRWQYSEVKPNSQYKISFQMTQLCNNAVHCFTIIRIQLLIGQCHKAPLLYLLWSQIIRVVLPSRVEHQHLCPRPPWCDQAQFQYNGCWHCRIHSDKTKQ